MNTEIAEVHFTIMKLRRAIGTNPKAELTADTLILVNQGYTSLDIFIKGGAWASLDTWGINAVQAGNRLEVLVDSVIRHLFRPNLIYSNQFRNFWITKRWFHRIRGQIVLQFTGHYA
jgi:hypothetical protein